MNRKTLRMLQARIWLAGIIAVSAGIALPVSPASAQGQGVLEGRVINRTDPEIKTAGVNLDVLELAGGMSIIKTVTTDASGRFRIEGLPTNAPLMVRADYQSANYHSPVRFDASGKASAEIEIFEATASRAGIREQRLQLAFQQAGSELHILETIAFPNETAPPRTFASPDGTWRFPKPPGILEPPAMTVQAPGATAPLAQSPLESPDGTSYYSLYPLKPGVTTFEARGLLPYTGQSYVYRRKFDRDLDNIELGITPRDMRILGEGLKLIHEDLQNDFAVYSAGPIKAGTEVTWTFSGGTPGPPPAAESSEGTMLRQIGTAVVRQAPVLGPLLLMGFLAVLWYAYNRIQDSLPEQQKSRIKELRMRRERQLARLANLDRQYETQALDRGEYLREREQSRRLLRRIALLMKK